MMLVFTLKCILTGVTLIHSFPDCHRVIVAKKNQE